MSRFLVTVIFTSIAGVLLQEVVLLELRADEMRQTEADGQLTADLSFFYFPRNDKLGLSERQERILIGIQDDPTTIDFKCVQLNLDALDAKGPVPLVFFGRSYSAWKIIKKQLGFGSYVWRGVMSADKDFVSLDINGNAINGTVRSDTFLYQIEPLGKGFHAVVRIKILPEREHPGEFPSGAQIDLDQQFSSVRSRKTDEVVKPELFKLTKQTHKLPMLFKSEPVQTDLLDSAIQKQLAAIQSRTLTDDVYVCKFDAASVSANTQKLMLNLSSDLSLSAFRKEVIGPDHSSGTFTWLGELVMAPNNIMNLIVNDEMCSGTLRYADELFEIRPLERNLHVLIRVDLSKLPQEHPPAYRSGAQQDNGRGY